MEEKFSHLNIHPQSTEHHHHNHLFLLDPSTDTCPHATRNFPANLAKIGKKGHDICEGDACDSTQRTPDRDPHHQIAQKYRCSSFRGTKVPSAIPTRNHTLTHITCEAHSSTFHAATLRRYVYRSRGHGSNLVPHHPWLTGCSLLQPDPTSWSCCCCHLNSGSPSRVRTMRRTFSSASPSPRLSHTTSSLSTTHPCRRQRPTPWT